MPQQIFGSNGGPSMKHLSKALLLSAAACALAGQAQANETVNIGACVSWPSYAMTQLAQSAGLVEGYDFNVTIFEDPLGGHAALAAGQIDVYGCTADYIPVAADAGLNVANVAFLTPSYGVDHIILAGGIEAKNLPGKKIAAPQAYIGHLQMGLWLDSQGIAPDQVEWVNLNADEAVGPMLSGDLAAAYMYEPWISRVLASSPGSRSVANTAEAASLKTGIFMDSLFMNKDFIANRREAALAVLKAEFDGRAYWSANVEAANQQIADFLQWSVEDVVSVIGDNGKALEGGTYTMDFDESARFCGALEGEPPFGTANGSMVATAKLTNEWWIKLGLLSKEADVASAIDCSLMSDLAKSGYRSAFSAK